MKLGELIQKNPHKPAVEIAKLALRQDREGVIAVVCAEVDRQRRAEVRSVERSIIGPLMEAEASTTRPSSQARAALTKTFVSARNGVPIEWALATVEDHKARIEFLRKHVEGCERTMRYHEEAIKKIENAGVSCLAEVGEPVDVPVDAVNAA